MSQENVEIVRRAYDGWNTSDVDAVLAVFHPDIEFGTSGVFPGLDPLYSRHDGFRKFWRDFSDTWDAIQISVQELRDRGERVLALVTFEARGRDGMEVRRQAGSVFTFRDGLVIRVENHADWAGALEAVGARP